MQHKGARAATERTLKRAHKQEQEHEYNYNAFGAAVFCGTEQVSAAGSQYTFPKFFYMASYLDKDSLQHFFLLLLTVWTPKHVDLLMNIKIFGIPYANNVFYSVHSTLCLKNMKL